MVLIWGIFYFSCNAQGRFPDPGFSPKNYRQQRPECQDYYKVDVSLKTLWKVGGIDVLDIELEIRGQQEYVTIGARAGDLSVCMGCEYFRFKFRVLEIV